MKYYLYNPKSNNGIKPEFLKDVKYKEVIGLDYKKFFASLKPEDEVVFVGGDGTLNYLINAIDTEKLKNKVYLKSAGTGNDFMNDIDVHDGREVYLNDYMKNLPIVYVNGMKKKYINGIGYGIDGYCCEEGDRQRAKSVKKINYTNIAIKGLLFAFQPKHAEITVDGKKYEFDNVWLAPAMKGRFYGGGMMIAPAQDRLNKKQTLTCVVYACKSKLKSLIAFPEVFKGEHVKRTDMVHIMEGKKIEVKFDKPCALQIDGETVLNVSSYKVEA